ncbi:PAS domain S-box protein [Colwellia sp. Arc7-635]|uniref:PAS domain S-box protein n=1 Tax=Colwellia sp. Arc7-635 TaxID=2497879 RepID=UPI000F859FF4|nr:PAS domain S-box protein [Colwellia sp. Arc7-635]AZQ84387.1 PAS domain S-box protein [Colwellia sp. Arc7-635]
MSIKKANEPIHFFRRRTILFYSIIIGVFVGSLICLALVYIEDQSTAHINRLTQNSTNGIALLIEDDLSQRINSLSEFTKLSQLTTNMTDGYWQSISNALYDGQRGYHTLGWVDKTYHIRKVTPFEGNENAKNFNLALKPAALAALMKAQEKNTVTMTMPLQSIHGELGLGIYVPVFRESEGTPKVEGFISSLILFNTYFTEILPSYLLTDHQIAVFIDEQEIYSDTANQDLTNTVWRRQISFQLQGQTWQIRTSPTSAFLEYSHYRTMRVLLVLGILLTVLITIAAYTTLSTRNKANVIRDERNKVRHLLKNLPGMAYQSFNMADWPLILVSEGCETLTGYTRAEFEAHDVLWGKIIHPDDYDRVHKVVHEAIIHQQPYELEYRIIDKNQETHFVWEKGEAVVSLLNDSMILEGFITDLTSIKQAEDEVARSHEFSDAVVNAVIEAVITIDQKGRIKSFNNAAQRMFGYCADEVINQSVNILIPSTETYDHDRHIANYVKSNIPKIMGVGRELEAKRKDGTVFPIQISVSEISNQDNKMFVGLIRDIGAQRLSEDRARKHIEQMAHADRLNSLGEMAAGIAHEVNQPLTAISLFSQSGKTLCNNGKFDKLPEIFDKLSQHARRAGAVLERMQTMTRQGDRQKELVECRALISEVVKLAESEGRMRDINIQVNFKQSSHVEVYIDRVQIQQVLLNLLRNGMEAMQSIDLSNGNVIELNSDFNDSENITISVVDSGCGLDINMTEKLFTAFASTKQNGMGIGLSISKSIIEDHGGSIHYAKNASAGSVFYFTLPVV